MERSNGMWANPSIYLCWTITSWEGIDPREYVFVSGGGAAGIHIIPMMADL